MVRGRVNGDYRKGDGIPQTDRNTASPFAIGSVVTDDCEAAEGGVFSRVKPCFAKQDNVVILREKLKMGSTLKERTTVPLKNTNIFGIREGISHD